ncbi:MAG: prepilin peptidase [Thermovenabulum sp.]|uniref:prepilin peptidase n=1 Tax=Thermovenabulum sp. TaxID=3100335 RepID=UPI003C7E6CD8
MLIAKKIIMYLLLTHTAYTDIKRLEIENYTIAAGITAGIIFNILERNNPVSILITTVIVFFIYLILALLGMGGGDLKLAVMLSLFYPDIIKMANIISFSFILSFIYSLYLIIFKKAGMKTHMPYAPFIMLAVILYEATAIRIFTFPFLQN